MRALFFCNVDFVAWPTHIAARLKALDPTFSADAVVTHDPGMAAALRAQDIFVFDTVDCLSDHEAEWLDADDIEERLAAHAATLGEQALLEIATGDRELSGHLVRGALYPLTPLQRATREPSKRRAYLAGLLDHLSGIIRHGNYDFVFCYSVQDAPSVAAAFIARSRGIDFLSPKAIGFGAATCLFDDPRNMAPCFRTAYADHLTKGDPADGAGAQLLATFRARPAPPDYMGLANQSAVALPSVLDTAALIWRAITRRKPATLRDALPLSRLCFDWRRALVARLLTRSARFSCKEALARRPYIYFPLHYEPEASTLVSAPDCTDQIALLERLSAAMPEGWALAVKEHRPMLGRRPSGYYHHLAKLPNVLLISPFEDSFAMIRDARLTATITGSAGLESVLLGRPTLFFGDHPVQIIGAGSHRARDESASDSIAKALATPAASEAQLVAFLAALSDASVEIPAADIWGGLNVISFMHVAKRPHHVDRFAQITLEAHQTRSQRR